MNAACRQVTSSTSVPSIGRAAISPATGTRVDRHRRVGCRHEDGDAYDIDYPGYR